jgi:hypothetical protein
MNRKTEPSRGEQLLALHASPTLDQDVCPTTSGLVAIADATPFQLRCGALFHKTLAARHAEAASHLERLGWRQP